VQGQVGFYQERMFPQLPANGSSASGTAYAAGVLKTLSGTLH
jgi:hypothetical protein